MRGHNTTSNPLGMRRKWCRRASWQLPPAAPCRHTGKLPRSPPVTIAHAGDRAATKERGAMLRSTLSLIAVLASIATASQASEIHRVVTTLDAANKSTTLADSQVTLNVSPSGNASANLWLTTSSPPGFSFNEDVAKPTGLNPPDNGTVIRVVEIPPRQPAACR